MQQAVLEVRFADAYRIWDASGQLWEAAQAAWPEITQADVNPNNVAFVSKSNRYDLVAKIDTAFFRVSYPDLKFEIYLKDAAKFIELVCEVFNVNIFLRVGYREIYSKEYPDRKSATDVVENLGLLKLPSEKKFNVEGDTYDPQYLGRWEGDIDGVAVRINAVTEKIEFDAPNNIPDLESIQVEKYKFVFDVDKYLHADTPVGAIKLLDWLSQGHQVIRRDSKIFLGE